MSPLRQRVPEPVKQRYREARVDLGLVPNPTRRATSAFLRQYGPVVRRGPFAGMAYPPYALKRSEVLVARLLGAFECELADAVEAAIAAGPDTVVNIGAADGYYAVGLARACPGITILGYELNPAAEKVGRALAAHNGVESAIAWPGEATIERLASLEVGSEPLVVSDCEGAEIALLDPTAVPWLSRARLIVELHEFLEPGTTQSLCDRFAASHEIELIDSRCRWRGEWPDLEALQGVTYVDRDLALSEFRSMPQQWAVMVPRS